MERVSHIQACPLGNRETPGVRGAMLSFLYSQTNAILSSISLQTQHPQQQSVWRQNKCVCAWIELAGFYTEPLATLKKATTKKDPAIQPGRPLPKFGTCEHYKKSCRWLRSVCNLSLCLPISYVLQVSLLW